jgi:putative spermidine/putrescine transport system ATP-binding protein
MNAEGMIRARPGRWIGQDCLCFKVAGTMVAAVSFRQVSRHFGTVKAVDAVDLDIAPGEFFAMLGPSGSGKTTCLRLIAGFEQPSTGAISIFGERAEGVPPYRRNVNTVFQDYALFPHLSVLDNVAYGLMVKGVARAERGKAAEEALALVKLPGYGARRPAQLSGGQRQRVALARALVNKPKVLLLDEPLGALDLKLREAMQEELKSLQKALGITFVFVTHDQGEALSMADRVAVFNDGHIMQVGTPEEIYQRPRTRFVADFVGSSNVLPPDFVQRWSGQRRWGSLRPEAIRVARPAGGEAEGVPAKLVATSYLGATTRLTLEAEGLRLNAMVPAGSAVPGEGETLMLSFNREQLHLMEEGA